MTDRDRADWDKADWDRNDARRGYGRGDPERAYGDRPGRNYRDRPSGREGASQGDEETWSAGRRQAGDRSYRSQFGGRMSDDRGVDRQRGDEDRYWRDDDRGFLDRAGDEVRSWFGDEDAERRRREDERRDTRGGERQDYYGTGSQESGRGYHDHASGSQDYGQGGERRDFGRGGRDVERGGRRRDWQSGSFGGYRADRNRGQEGRFGESGQGASSGRLFGEQSGQREEFGQSNYDQDLRGSSGDRQPGRDQRQSARPGSGVSHFDEHYQSWRARQLDELDREYEEFRRQRHEDFEREFAAWRDSRRQSGQAQSGQAQSGQAQSGQAQSGQAQPGRADAAAGSGGPSATGGTGAQHAASIREHMEVVGSDGKHVGSVDAVDGDWIKLTRSDPDAHGRHHLIPLEWVTAVDRQVRLSKSAEDAERRWREVGEGGQGAGG